MPIFLKENSSLEKNRYSLPKDMEKHLNDTLHTYGQYTDAEGAKRLRTLTNDDYNKRSDIDDGNISYSAIKDWNHALEHCDKSPDNLTYQLNGGDKALNYTRDLLRKERTKVKKQNAQKKVSTRQLNSTKPIVNPTSAVKPTAADANDIKVESVRTIRLTEKQLNILREYRNEPILPFDGDERKENYLQFIDWLEEIGQYGSLPSSQVKLEDFNNEETINYVVNLVQDEMGMFDDIVSDTLMDIELQYADNFEEMSELDNDEYRTELGWGNVEAAYDSLTSLGIQEFNEFLQYNIKNEIDIFFSSCPLSTNERNLVYIERAIEIPELLSKDVNLQYDNENKKYDLYTFLLKRFGSSVGTCWSYKKNTANIYGGGCFYQKDKTAPIILHAYVDLSDANMPYTIGLNLYDLKDEEELRLKEGAKVEIFEIVTVDGKKFPLKQPIIVQA